MTMLEKAIEAVHHVERRKGDAFDVGDEGARDIVRAVLLAIREPGTRFSQNGREAFFKSPFNDLDRSDGIYVGNGAFSETFTAMIDAILAEPAEAKADIAA